MLDCNILPCKLIEQSTPLKPGSQSHTFVVLSQLPLSLQDESSIHTKSGHFPSCKGLSPGHDCIS